ncbi:hypothetical protein MVEN_00552700 [Mycena venus]|uniref:Uncharacterized protein n=1 Tax=Mycena venus TaxID=2733690 RepID=A0A8H6YNS0_9AGAR|nr:hypothetical protein MVEN_00552700 [Mycena venus]
MDNVTPADLPLPAFLDPLLAYLSDNLPGPVYSFLITFISHLLAVCTALYALLLSLLSTHPLQWDAQTVLPPLIALLTSYLAIVSLYRTTSWMFRTSLWFMKWGTLLGGIVAGTSWLLFQQDGNGLAGRGLVAGLGSMVLNMLNGEGRNAAGGPRTRSRSRKQAKKSPGTRMKKPKPWDSFEAHREWQYQENGGAGGGDAQDVLADLMDKASKVVTENGWWEVAKGVFAGQGASQEESESSQGQKRKGNTKTR